MLWVTRRDACARGGQVQTAERTKVSWIKLEEANNCTAAQEWLAVILFKGILSTVHVIRAFFALHPSGAELPRNVHWSYNHRLFSEFEKRRKRLLAKDRI